MMVREVGETVGECEGMARTILRRGWAMHTGSVLRSDRTRVDRIKDSGPRDGESLVCARTTASVRTTEIVQETECGAAEPMPKNWQPIHTHLGSEEVDGRYRRSTVAGVAASMEVGVGQEHDVDLGLSFRVVAGSEVGLRLGKIVRMHAGLEAGWMVSGLEVGQLHAHEIRSVKTGPT